MKTFALFCLLLLIPACAPALTARAATLTVGIRHTFDSAPLSFGRLMTNETGNTLSITRLDYLLSNFTLVSADGRELALTNQAAFISASAGRDRFSLTNVPSASLTALRFRVGVDPQLNHADPSAVASNHPLNPNLNGLHWSWQGGYIFLALEGHWLTPAGQQNGYSYHLATDQLLMTVELPVTLDMSSDRDLGLMLNVGKIFAGQHRISITEECNSTHSRPNDDLAARLARNVERAFVLESMDTSRAVLPASRGANKIEIASNATPYRLVISRFFPKPALPLDNPLTEEGVELGRRLFHDPTLSINNSQSCASCHRAEAAFTDSRRYSLGAEGQTGKRNAMPLFNLAWKTTFFWDGRALSLRDQVLQPIQNPAEMRETLTNVVEKLGARASNHALFARVFGTPEITPDRIARALEQFLLTRVSHNSKFDRSLAGKVELNEDEKRGFELFHTEYDPRHGQFGADCFHCHGGPLFQSQSFANNGLDAACQDLGRSLVTGKPEDRGKFSVPSLRNISLTGPYMHDGRFATLEEVVAHYSSGIHRSATLDPNLAKHPDGGLHLSAEDQRALVTFLKTLTDE